MDQPHIRIIPPSASPFPSPPTISWESQSITCPLRGTIRLLNRPPDDLQISYTDRSLTQWIEGIADLISSTADDIKERGHRIQDLFYENQRQRWLAFKVLRTLTQRCWSRKIKCDMELVTLGAIQKSDEIFLTDTTNRTIFRFHRRDVLQNLLSNLSQSANMIASPRPPTNPFTNSILTQAQCMSLCHQLLRSYTRGVRWCPPTLFAAFWASKFDMKRFYNENSATLSQGAIFNYFKEICDENRDTMLDTISALLTTARRAYSLSAIRKWLSPETPTTALHKDWLNLVRDYYLYMNMHIQARPHWYSPGSISMDRT